MDIITYKKINKTRLYDTYWEFACKRQEIFMNRVTNKTSSKNTDPILKKYKFTNVYRASDRASQYLIKNVIYNNEYSDEDIIFRILLFKLFNKIETWEAVEKCVGEITYSNFSKDRYAKVFNTLYKQGKKLYSGAYIMASGKNYFGHDRKYMNHLELLEYMMKDNLTNRIHDCKTLDELYAILLNYPSIGKFLAYQYAIDINYSNITDFDEMEFVVAGPGAKSGINKCFMGSTYSDSYLIEYMANNQEQEFTRLGLKFRDLWGRKLQLIDCQNLFCETDKYTRVKFPDIEGINGRKKIKQLYKQNNKRIEYFYPPKWNLKIGD